VGPWLTYRTIPMGEVAKSRISHRWHHRLSRDLDGLIHRDEITHTGRASIKRTT
jgi:hypothetical protein